MSETNNLTPMAKEELKDVTKAYTNEEYEVIIKCIPDEYLWLELIRRYNAMIKGVENIATILGVTLDNIIPISGETWKGIRDKYDDLKERFSKIRKGTGVSAE